ncbi:outer membrane beta-barrel protein [Algoriphagus yeomjeoni]|uniref:outer membrane beta-barrel protein n=1 Tax=Algoriphagus yeomjeoni TaxID=291403 RepID=UPI003CE58BAD
MKRFLLGLFLFQLFTFAANAQIQKGSIMLGGNLNYMNSSSNSNSNISSPSTVNSTTDGKSNSFTFNPKVGFTLSNNWVVGPMLILSSSKGTSESNWLSGSNSITDYTTTKNSSFGAGAFARKYIQFSDNFSAFGEVNATLNNRKEYRSSENSSQFEEAENKFNEIQGSIQAGLAYFPKNWIAIELSANILQYSHYGQNRDTELQDFETNQNSFGFNLNASAINLGVSFFLNNK